MRWLAWGSWLVLSTTAAAEEDYGAQARATRDTFEGARSVSVVRKERGDETAAGNVGDLLERAPSVVVQRTASGSATPILRGLTGYQVLLMADDLRLNDSLTRAGGSATLNLIDPESVDHIDVIRGPASVLYGSDALGGVVHVRTRGTGARENAEPSGSATAYLRGATAERGLRGRAAVHGVAGPYGVWLSGGRSYAGEVRRGDGLGPQPFTGHEDWSLSSRVEVVPERDHRVAFAHQSGHIFDMPRSDVSTPDDRQTTVMLDRNAGTLSYTGRLLDRRLRLHAFFGTIVRREHRTRERGERVDDEHELVLGFQGGVRAGVLPWRFASLEFGLESTVERIDSYATTTTPEEGRVLKSRGRYVDDSAYDMHAAYALLSQALSPRTLLLLGGRSTLVVARAPVDPLFEPVLGARAALDRKFAGVVGSAGVRHEIGQALVWNTSFLSGFRAPNLEDFQAFGGGARGFTVPNLSLREERSYTLETGFELSLPNWTAQVYAFGSLLSGLVVRVPSTLDGMSMVDGEPVISRRNGSKARLVGAEMNATYHSDLGIFASVAGWFTWGEAERPDDEGRSVHEPAAKVPPPIGVLRVGYRNPNIPYFGEVNLRGQLAQPRLSEGDKTDVRLCPEGPETCREVPGFWDATLRAGVRLKGVLVTFSIENLFDAAYRTYASGAYAPGRNYVLAARGTL